MKWFGVELGVKSSYAEKEKEGVRAMLNGHHMAPDLQVVLDKFILTYVTCPNCGYPEMSILAGKRDELHGKCNACPFAGFLKPATEHKMAGFVVKSLQESGGDAGGGKASRAEKQMAKEAKNRGKNVDEGDSDDDDDEDDG